MLATLHLLIAALTIVFVLYSDEQAFLWVVGKKEFMDQSKVTFLHHAISGLLALLIITGGITYVTAAPAYLSLNTFVVKMVMVFVLIINTYFIDRLSAVALTRSYASLSLKERIPLFISGAVSFLGWMTAFVCGLLIA